MPLKKFVNLDMEEYPRPGADARGVQQVLDEEEFKRFSAGIVLQAYLPDSWAGSTATDGVGTAACGGRWIADQLRIVKGANLAMEQVEAELHGWEKAPYGTKADTDANYRRMVEFGCRPENAAAVRLGVASHNLFDVALALVLRDHFDTAAHVELEMLEGMANHQARAVQSRAGGLLVYAPR